MPILMVEYAKASYRPDFALNSLFVTLIAIVEPFIAARLKELLPALTGA